jgi:hypothetical protein
MLHLSLSLFLVAPTLEHRASVKRFVSFQFLNHKTVGRTPWMGVFVKARVVQGEPSSFSGRGISFVETEALKLFAVYNMVWRVKYTL